MDVSHIILVTKVHEFYYWCSIFLLEFTMSTLPSCSWWAKSRKLRFQIQELGARLDQWLLTRSGGFAGGSGNLLTSHWTRALGKQQGSCLIYLRFIFETSKPVGNLDHFTQVYHAWLRVLLYHIHIAAYNGNHRPPSTFHVAFFHWITRKPMARQTKHLVPSPKNHSIFDRMSCHLTIFDLDC